MTTLYKLTDENWMSGYGYNPLKWGPGVTHTLADGGGPYASGWLYAYTSPELAALLNPTHADFESPILWRAEGDVGIDVRGLKVGTTQLTTHEIIPLPECTTEQRVRFGVFCALEVDPGRGFVEWAAAWLSGSAKRATKADAYSWADASARAAGLAAAANTPEFAAYSAAQAAHCAVDAKPVDLIGLARRALSGDSRMQGVLQ